MKCYRATNCADML